MATSAPAIGYTSFCITIASILAWHLRRSSSARKAIPRAKTSSRIPFIGQLLEYEADPLAFILKQKQIVGEVFRLNVVLINVTFLVGAKWNRWLLRETEETDVSLTKLLPLLTCGIIGESLIHSGWLERASKRIRCGVNFAGRLEQITQTSVQTGLDSYEEWAQTDRLPLFAASTTLLVRSQLIAYFGREFVEIHATELLAMGDACMPALLSPWTRLLPLWASPSGRKLSAAKARLTRMMGTEIQERLENIDLCRESHDFLSFQLTQDFDKGLEPCESEYTLYFLIFFLAAYTNIAGTFAWTTLHLIRNPQAMARFETEIAQNTPSQHGIYPLKNMPFTKACLRETGRLYTNLLTVHYVTGDMRGPDGIIIPKGYAVASPMAVHRDPNLYDNPDKWNPGRFLPGADGTPSDYTTRLRNVEFHQFGIGNHACPGERLSHSILRGALWPTLIDNCEVEVVGGLVEGEGVDGLGVKPDWGKNLGTPYAGKREVFIKVTKRPTRFSDAPHSATTSS